MMLPPGSKLGREREAGHGIRPESRIGGTLKMGLGVRCLALLLPLAVAEARADTLERVDRLVRDEMARQKVPGVAVAIVDHGAVLKAEGYGYANVEHGVPVRPDTVFQSGSLGKQFTAATVMTLVEDGKIGLDDPIAKYFPEAPEPFRAVTVRHLLTHTSGIPDYTEGTIDLRRDYTEDELIRMAFALRLEFAPGSRWNYSNTGYLMLGVLVRRASGRFYGDVLRDRVFGPLGMKTARIISEEDIVPHRAAGYRLVEGELKNQEWVAPRLNTTADGSLYFTVLDLVAWDRGLRAGAVLKPESWAAIFQPVRLSSGKTFPYGFGWSIEEAGGRPLVEHGGSWQGFRTHIARYLGDDLTIIVLANLAEAEPERFVRGIATILDAKLAPPPPMPIADREPEVTARLRGLLAAAREGRLSPDEFAYVRAGFFPATPRRYAELLRGLGEPRRIDLLERRELGDDRVYRYLVTYEGGRILRVRLGVAPDGKLSALSIAPE
jgi:CubicO group peptidase (beta-lactamase class C family)